MNIAMAENMIKGGNKTATHFILFDFLADRSYSGAI
jgi:hypothetical protein